MARPGVALGIDLGVQHLAVMADSAGEIRYVSNPKHYDTPGDGPAASVPACVSRRRGPDKRTGQKPSTRWCNANAERDRVHHRVANLRADALPKLTTAVREEYGTVVVEDLRRRRDAAQPAPRPHDF